MEKVARRLFILDQLVMGEDTSEEFGTITRAFGKVRMRVERKVMSSTTPSIFGVEIQSSTANGLSSRMTKPPKRFCAVSCAASAKVKPPRPRPVMMVVTLVPVSLRIAMAARTIKSTLSAFFKKVISVLLRLTSSCSSSLLPKRKKESEAQSHSRRRIHVTMMMTLMRYTFSRKCSIPAEGFRLTRAR